MVQVPLFLVSRLAFLSALSNLMIDRVGSSSPKPCDRLYAGYQCEPTISQNWGQYSPFFSVTSSISAEIPPQCEITFAQILSRHGARDPTASKTRLYNATINGLKSSVTRNFTGKYAFLASYEYTLGADQLTTFGQQELINSGIKFYRRYESLTRNTSLFVRSSSESRVVESAQNFTQGFHYAKGLDSRAPPDNSYPYPILTISEDAGSNNTLNHGLCTAFENGTYYSSIANTAEGIFLDIFTEPIRHRLNSDLPGANLSTAQTLYMMDLCPFNTVASSTGAVSKFCDLFTSTEWQQYSYYESLDKYYGYGAGNPLGPTQGVGWANELIARLTDTPVVDHTSTNRTLDSNNATFPIGHTLFADFSHDNDMTAIVFALGLYNSTSALSNTSVETVSQTDGYSAAWTVPFAARVYFEKMTCHGEDDEWVRVIVNDRVIALEGCGGDERGLGRCKLDKWVQSLSFAREGGRWGECFD